MNEKELITKAASGDISAMKELVNYYDGKAGGGFADKVGDVMTMEDFNKMLAAQDEKGDEEYKALAYKYCLMAAEAGDAWSMTEVGSRLYDAIGVEKNNEASDIWYKRGAEAGDISAMRVVAFNSKDDAEKFKWYKLHAELAEPGLNKNDSIKQTAINYACGRGTAINLAAAEEWLAKLDKNSAGSAMQEIARITGDNSWLERAGEFDPMAMIRIAESFWRKDDFINALKFYKRAADKDSFHMRSAVLSIIGDIYYIGEKNIKRDYSKAFKYYTLAGDYNMARIKRALMMYRGLGTEKNLEAAFKEFDKISWSQEKFFGPFRFNSVARYYAAVMQENGEGCDKDLYKAFERYRLAGGVERITEYESPHKIAKALLKIADAYFLGNGTRQNFRRALYFYKLAYKHGEGQKAYKLEAAKKIMFMYELGEDVPQDKAKAAEWRAKVENFDER